MTIMKKAKKIRWLLYNSHPQNQVTILPSRGDNLKKKIWKIKWLNWFKGRLNIDTSPQNFWTTFLDNDFTEKFKKSAVANTIAIPLPLCFSCFVPLRRFRENLIKPFYLYLSRTCDFPGVTPSVISLALIPVI